MCSLQYWTFRLNYLRKSLLHVDCTLYFQSEKYCSHNKRNYDKYGLDCDNIYKKGIALENWVKSKVFNKVQYDFSKNYEIQNRDGNDHYKKYVSIGIVWLTVLNLDVLQITELWVYWCTVNILEELRPESLRNLHSRFGKVNDAQLMVHHLYHTGVLSEELYSLCLRRDFIFGVVH